MDTFAMINGTDAKGPDGKRPRLSPEARNARASVAQVMRSNDGRSRYEVGYLVAKLPSATGFEVQTFVGHRLLTLDKVTKTRTNSFGFRATRVYFSGTDDKGRRWHGSSPGVGMFARMHRNAGRKARPRPVSRAALRRALAALVSDIVRDNKVGADGPFTLTKARNPFAVHSFIVAHTLAYRELQK